MSDVNAGDLRVIKDENDVLHAYAGAGADSRAGIEIEMAFFDAKTLAPMTIPQNKTLKNVAMNALPGDWVRNEPTSETIEANGAAFRLGDIRPAFDDLNRKIKLVTDKAAAIGLKRSYFQELPEKTAADLLKSVVPVPRYQAFFAPPRADMQGFASYFAVCKSNQVSVSYRDADQALRDVRRLYFLAPFLFLLTDNSSYFREGKKFSGHQGMAFRREGLLEGRGFVPPYIFTAQSGEEYIRAHIEHVMNNPLFVHYDLNGGIVKLPAGTWTNFRELAQKGLNTATNYYFAETILWPDVKIAALRDEAGEVVNHRYEARMLGVGVHQHQTSFLIVSALAHNESFAEDVDALLARYGFDADNLEDARANLIAAYDAAQNHDNKFFDIAYGRGRMKNFAKEFADLIEITYDGAGLDEELSPLLSICRSGCTDAKINRLLFDTLEKTLAFQKNYDPAIFNDPNRAARDLFKKEMRAQGINACCCAS